MNKNSDDPSTSEEAMNLEFARAQVNAAFDRWFRSQLLLRDLINDSASYTCNAYDISASAIKQAMRHALIDTLSKVYRFECLRERIEGISITDGNGSEPTETQQ